MNKLLLTCLLSFGIGATAQITASESFETGTSWPGFTTTNLTNGTEAACDGTKSLYRNIYYNSIVPAILNYASADSNGKKIDYSFSLKTYPYDDFSSVAGNMIVEYSIGTGAFVQIGTTYTLTANQDCLTFTGSIAAGIATIGKNFRLRITTTRDASGDFNASYDKVIITQLSDVAPLCTTVTLPTNGANPADSTAITWTTTLGATSYKVYLGTTPGGNEIANGTTTTNTYYSLSEIAANTTYYIKIVPTNANGDATGCAEGSFTTGNTSYCVSIPNNYDFNDGITNVSLNGETVNIANPTSSAAGIEYTDYTALNAPDLKREKSYNLSVSVNTDGEFTYYQIVWIDWNQNSIFEASERYNLGTATNVSNGVSSLSPFAITVPSTAVLGNTRMRVRTFYSTEYYNDPCKSGDDGEVEDYTIKVLEKEVLAASSVSKNETSVYPNPFQDVLKISDVKGVKSISINDASGRQVKSMKAASELNLSELKTGLYIVNLNMEDGTVKSIKAIKK